MPKRAASPERGRICASVPLGNAIARPVGTTARAPGAIVTGASSGIGFELARQCADNGFDLIICAENHEIERAAGDLASTADIQVRAIVADLEVTGTHHEQ